MKLTAVIQIRVTREMDAALERIAKARRLRGDNKSDVIRDAIAEHIERVQAQCKP